ncbi:hypothetical protein D9M68_516860 [compost metagenome]
MIKRGDKQIDMTSVSAVTKLYQVTDAGANGYRLSITTKQVTDTLNALENTLAYSSDRAANQNSEIEMAISKLVNDTYSLSLDKTGKITKVDDPAKATLHKEIAATINLYHKELAVGNFLNFGSSFEIPAGAKKGTTWNVNEDGAKSTFTINEFNAETTTVAFKSEASETGINTSLNGLSVIDNATGVVIKRALAISTMSKEQSGDKSYMAARKYRIAEVCNKIN